MSAQMEYWKEALSESAKAHGVCLTEEQLSGMADDIRVSHENMGLAFYQPPAEPDREVERLKKELKEEKSLVFCKRCNGTGRLIAYVGTFMSDTSCHECNGRGKHQ